jgi:hypothetical protein
MWVFIISSIIFFNAAAFYIKKRLTVPEMYATIMFALFVEEVVDEYASFELEAWGFFMKDRVELEALWIILGIYPAATVLIVNWYPYAARWWKKALYLLGWAVFSTGYEAITMKLDIIWHASGWTLWKSFMMYPLIYYMVIFQVRVYRWIVQKWGKV